MGESAGDVGQVLTHLRDLVERDLDVEAAHLLAQKLGDPDFADSLIPPALELARLSPQPAARMIIGAALARLRPAYASTWRQVADIARSTGDYRTLADALVEAARTPEGRAEDRLGAALAAYQDNDLDRAEMLYQTVEDHDAADCGLAVIALARGAVETSAVILRRLLQRTPGSVNALRLLAMVDPDPEVLSALAKTARSERTPAEVRSAAAFALAQAYDRDDDPDAAMSWAALANETARQRARPYDRAAQEQAAEDLLNLFDRLPPPDRPLLNRPRPIVIVGLPRSGTSLVESLLAAHPGVIAGGERTDLSLACREIEIVLRSKGPDAASRLFARRREGLVQELADRLFRAGIDSDVYLDKLPLNTPYAGLIARLLPEAKILFVRRDPVETALSIWLHDFSQAYAYASDLNALSHAVGLNDRLRDAWKDRLGEQFLEIDHDALCADPALEGRRMFEFCGLEWDDAYLDPRNRRSATNTFSALQVRQAIRPRQPRAPLYQDLVGPLARTLGAP